MQKILVLVALIGIVSASFWEGKYKVLSTCHQSQNCCCAKKNTIIEFSRTHSKKVLAENKSFDDIDACSALGWDFNNSVVLPWLFYETEGTHQDEIGVQYTLHIFSDQHAVILMDQSSVGLSDNCLLSVYKIDEE